MKFNKTKNNNKNWQVATIWHHRWLCYYVSWHHKFIFRPTVIICCGLLKCVCTSCSWIQQHVVSEKNPPETCWLTLIKTSQF